MSTAIARMPGDREKSFMATNIVSGITFVIVVIISQINLDANRYIEMKADKT